MRVPKFRSAVAVALLTAVTVLPLAVPSPAAAAPGIELLSLQSYVDRGGDVEYAGQVVNHMGHTVNTVIIKVDERSSTGTSVGTTTAGSSLTRLDDGEVSSFWGSFAPPAGYDHVAVTSMNATQAYNPANNNFTTTVTDRVTDQGGDQHLKGTIRNDNNAPTSDINLYATFFDASGTPVDVKGTTVYGPDGSTTLAAGETVPFDIMLYTYDGPAEVSYKVIGDGGEDPSPLPTTLTASGGGVRTYGQHVSIAGRLSKRGTPSVVQLAPVQLMSKTAGSSTWVVAARSTTDYAGNVTFSPAPAKNTSYQIVAPASSRQVGSASRVLTATVNAALVSRLSATSAPLGHAVTLTTTVRPGEAGRPVTLQRLVSGRWTNVVSHTLTSSSGSTFSVRPSARGTYTYRTTVTATSTNGAGASPAVTLKVT